MENASKALLMAGGVLLALLTISILVFAFNRMSATQRVSNQDTAEQTTIEFNNQFSTYNNDRVRGSDLLSCLNRALDYNRRYTTASREMTNNNEYNWRNSQYTPISIHLDFSDRDQLLWFDSTMTISLKFFREPNYDMEVKPDGTLVNEFKDIIGTYNTKGLTKEFVDGEIQQLENKYRNFGGAEMLTELASKLNVVFSGPTNGSTDTEKLDDINKVITFEGIITKDPVELKTIQSSFVNYVKTKDITEDPRSDTGYQKIKKDLNIIKHGNIGGTGTTPSDLYEDVCKYYEYIQFKRGIFECVGCEYDKNTGRISKMSFKFTGKYN